MKNPVHIRQFRFPDDFNPVMDLRDHSDPGVKTGRSVTVEENAEKQNKDPDFFFAV